MTVVAAHTLHVGVGEIGRTVSTNAHQGREIIHHRSASVSAGHKIMFQPEHVAHFMAGQQGEPVLHHLLLAGLRIEVIERGEGVQSWFGASRGIVDSQ